MTDQEKIKRLVETLNLMRVATKQSASFMRLAIGHPNQNQVCTQLASALDDATTISETTLESMREQNHG